MSYEVDRMKGEEAKKEARRREFSEDTIRRLGELVIIGSSFNDPGDDWCRYDAYDELGTLIDSKVEAGY